MERITTLIFCLFLFSCDQKDATPLDNYLNSHTNSIQTTDSIRKLQAKENYDKATFKVFRNAEIVNILSVKYNLQSNNLNDILVSYTELVNTIDVNMEPNRHTEQIKNYAFELGMEEKDFGTLLLEYIRLKKY